MMEASEPISHIEFIESSTGRHARIAGRGVKVRVIAVMVVYNHQSVDWIAENFDLTPAQIYAALSYYYDHKEQFDQEIEAARKLAEELDPDTAKEQAAK
jgi:uncharacterized protein (DUF433 family)